MMSDIRRSRMAHRFEPHGEALLAAGFGRGVPRRMRLRKKNRWPGSDAGGRQGSARQARRLRWRRARATFCFRAMPCGPMRRPRVFFIARAKTSQTLEPGGEVVLDAKQLKVKAGKMSGAETGERLFSAAAGARRGGEPAALRGQHDARPGEAGRRMCSPATLCLPNVRAELAAPRSASRADPPMTPAAD